MAKHIIDPIDFQNFQHEFTVVASHGKGDCKILRGCVYCNNKIVYTVIDHDKTAYEGECMNEAINIYNEIYMKP